jgi:hypothetical protein
MAKIMLKIVLNFLFYCQLSTLGIYCLKLFSILKNHGYNSNEFE